MNKKILTLALSACMSMGIAGMPAFAAETETPAATYANAKMPVAKVTYRTSPVSKNCTFQMEIQKGTWNKNTRVEINRKSAVDAKDAYAYDFTTTPLKNGNLLVETNSWIKQDDGVLRIRIFGDYDQTFTDWVKISGTVNTDQFFASMKFPGKSGWIQNADGTWGWYHPGGSKETYWRDIDGKTYRFTGTLANMVANQWFTEANQSYWLQGNGALAKNKWIHDGQNWYYVNEKGNPKTGWFEEKGKWYLLEAVDKPEDLYYYFQDGSYVRYHPGKMTESKWVTQKNKTFYFGKNGVMKAGWAEIDGKWYYFKPDGSMASNTTIDGYKLDANGVWIR